MGVIRITPKSAKVKIAENRVIRITQVKGFDGGGKRERLIGHKMVRRNERKRYQALALLAGDKKLSMRRISKLTGLRLEGVLVIRRKYLLAQFLGANVKEITDSVLLSHISNSLPIETYFCFCVIQCLIELRKIVEVKIFLLTTGELCRLMDIHADEIAGMDENSIVDRIEVIKKRLN